MMAASLQSGSNGNSIYVEAGGVKLLFDCGITGSKAERRLAALGRSIREVDALILSHDHADHALYAGVFQRKFGIPVYATAGTMAAASSRLPLGPLDDVRLFRAGSAIRFGNTSVETIPTPHDGKDGAAFVVCAEGRRLGILTDLGHVFDGLDAVVRCLDAVFIESNYDTGMLASGRYPAFLKRRIRGAGGHLSNTDSAELLLSGGRLRWACLAHLSAENNHPEVALQTHRFINPSLTLHVASRYCCTPLFSL